MFEDNEGGSKVINLRPDEYKVLGSAPEQGLLTPAQKERLASLEKEVAAEKGRPKFIDAAHQEAMMSRRAATFRASTEKVDRGLNKGMNLASQADLALQRLKTQVRSKEKENLRESGAVKRVK